MSLKKERIHSTGFSNIDFRTKNDATALQLFQPWKVAEHYGTINDYGYHLPYDEHKKIFEVSSPLNKQVNEINDLPDPKIYKSAQFYKDNKIRLNTRAMFTNERIAQLDESPKGKDKFIGDSMMISDINKIRKERKKKKRMGELEKKKKIIRQENIIKDKNKKNKEAYQETQLVNIEAEVTLEGKVDIKKLLEIRLALRRRYANRTNFRKIFKEWDQSIGGEITVYDAHAMINNLSIPINYNETRALIASSNTRGTETLNLEEFMHLIFSDNPALDVDLTKLKFKDEKLYTEGAQVENLKKNMKMNIMEMSKTDELNFLEKYLKTKKPMFLQKLAELELPSTDVIDFDTFQTVMKKFPLPDKFVKEPLLKAIYDNYKTEDDRGMNYKKFLDHCVEKKEPNDFFDFQSKYLDLVTEKISRLQNESEKQQEFLQIDKNKNNELKKIYEAQIEENKKRRELDSIKNDKITVSHSQPSLDFINLIFKDKELHYKKLNEVEDSFSPLPSLIKDNVGKTRFGANPRNINTKTVIQADPKSFLYINEKERFNIKGADFIDNVQNERYLNKLRKQEIYNRISKAVNGALEQSKFNQLLSDNKEALGLVQKTKRLYKYELTNKMRNEIIE